MAAIVSNAPDTASRVDRRAGKYLTFRLGREEFGMHVLQVREIMGLQDITAVPHTPAHVKGVINLRGRVIPVLCLRSKFGMETDPAGQSCIVVAQVTGEEGSIQVGVIVDAVSDVLNIAASDIEDTPNFGGGGAPPYLLGMAKIKGKVKILLDIDQVVKSTELLPLDGLGHEHDA
jgi:purine-binding chemotaxis protein CheW